MAKSIWTADRKLCDYVIFVASLQSLKHSVMSVRNSETLFDVSWPVMLWCFWRLARSPHGKKVLGSIPQVVPSVSFLYGFLLQNIIYASEVNWKCKIVYDTVHSNYGLKSLLRGPTLPPWQWWGLKIGSLVRYLVLTSVLYDGLMPRSGCHCAS